MSKNKITPEKRINIRVSVELHSLLSEAAKRRGVTMASFARMAAVEAARKILETEE